MSLPNKTRAELAKEVRSLRAQLSHRDKKIADLERLLIESRKQVDAEREERQQDVNSMSETVDELITQRDEWKKAAHDWEGHRDKWQAACQESNEQRDELCKKLTIAQNEIEELKRGLTSLREEYEKRTEELRISQSSHRATADTLEAFRKNSRRHLSPETVAEATNESVSDIDCYLSLIRADQEETVPAAMVDCMLTRIKKQVYELFATAQNRGNLTRRNPYFEDRVEGQK